MFMRLLSHLFLYHMHLYQSHIQSLEAHPMSIKDHNVSPLYLGIMSDVFF